MARILSSIFLYLTALAVGVLAASRILGPTTQEDACVSHNSPNPDAQQYPDFVSGNLNGTLLIVPIPLEKAREIIPDEYGIAEAAYRALLPAFPAGMYPMMAQIVEDHDIQFPAYNVSMPDFTRAAFEFPFVDLFHDGQSFRWAKTSLLTASNTAALEGTRGYGIDVYGAAFAPVCNAYAAVPGAPATAAVRAHSVDGNTTTERFMDLESTRMSGEPPPYPWSFVRNITNQVTFADPAVGCDPYRRLFNTSLTTGADHAPVPVVGSVRAALEPFAEGRAWEDVYGWRFASMFLEPPVPQSCSSFARAG
ncbi:hypothetical protein F4780DRAFT_775938 [Xylariomycetidae sp. FL0641]|nr:hypothetical protein F4780DRAFT_775938 [Xylariomycetidae sp. FL0641]